MSKAVMLSIRPKWCEKIASGEKTIEVRKTRPKGGSRAKSSGNSPATAFTGSHRSTMHQKMWSSKLV